MSKSVWILSSTILVLKLKRMNFSRFIFKSLVCLTFNPGINLTYFLTESGLSFTIIPQLIFSNMSKLQFIIILLIVKIFWTFMRHFEDHLTHLTSVFIFFFKNVLPLRKNNWQNLLNSSKKKLKEMIVKLEPGI